MNLTLSALRESILFARSHGMCGPSEIGMLAAARYASGRCNCLRRAATFRGVSTPPIWWTAPVWSQKPGEASLPVAPIQQSRVVGIAAWGMSVAFISKKAGNR